MSAANSTGDPVEGVADGVTEGIADGAAPGVDGAVMDWHVPRLFAAWGIAAVVGVLVTLFANEGRASWLVLAVGLATLASFALQLGTAQREGFISRLAFSIAGSVVVIAIIDAVGLILQALGR